MSASTKKLGTQTYSAFTVTRSHTATHEEIEKYDDATVRDQGENRLYGGAPAAMLRAYSNDPDFFGDEDYQRGNGIHVLSPSAAKRYNSPDMAGFVIDCDFDIALRRVEGIVLNKFSYGHGTDDWTMLVGYDKDDDEWGRGYRADNWRIETWRVELRKEES